jgi:hypothetical protein
VIGEALSTLAVLLAVVAVGAWRVRLDPEPGPNYPKPPHPSPRTPNARTAGVFRTGRR